VREPAEGAAGERGMEELKVRGSNTKDRSAPAAAFSARAVAL
jgi:hypothetical protein